MGNNVHPTEKVGRNPKIEQSVSVTTPENKKQIEVTDGPSTTTPKNEDKSKIETIKSAPTKLIRWIKGWNRNTKLAASLALILVLVGSIAILASRSGNETVEFANESQPETIETATPMGAAVTLSEGTLETKNEEGEWGEAPNNFQPKEGDSLRTVGAASRAIVSFDDGSALRLDANSEVELTTLTVERIVVRHLNGYTYNRVIDSESRVYIVESNDAQYEALGTAFRTASSGDEQSVEVFQSTVHETILNEKPTEGEKLTVKNKVDPTKDGNIEKLDIEQVKGDAFIQWNIEQDEKDENFRDKLGFLSDTEAPEVEISSHADGETVLLASTATQGSIEFSGKTEPRATLTVLSKSENGAQPVNVTVGDDGSFKTPVLTAPIGNSVFEFEVKDRRGNTATKNIRINFQRKSAPVTSTGSLTLKITSVEGNKVNLEWAKSGSLQAKDGYKLVYATDPQPTYGDADDSSQLTTKESATVKNLDNGTYYFRVCVYDAEENDCTNYSNQLSAVIDVVE